MAEHSQFLERDNFYLIKKLKKVDYFNMLRSILMIFIVEANLMYGIVTHVSEISQNLVHMNEKFWPVCTMPMTLQVTGPRQPSLQGPCLTARSPYGKKSCL